jgi:acyl carrier protein
MRNTDLGCSASNRHRRRVLDLNRSVSFNRETRGSVPELDSMAVATLLTSLEEHFGFVVADDEIDGSTFATVQSLVDFVVPAHL